MKRNYEAHVMAYVGERPGIVVRVHSDQEYAFNQWLKEARVERDNAGADFGIVVAKPRLVGTTRTRHWYGLMYSYDFLALVSQAAREAGEEVRVWRKQAKGISYSTTIGRDLLGAELDRLASGSTHSCVQIAPKGVKDPSMYYVVTTLEQICDLLVRAGYGRRDVEVGA